MIAEGKVDLALSLVGEYKNKVDSWFVVGDTFLDYSVAKEIGGHFVFTSWGHTAKNRFNKKGCSVCDDVSSLLKFFRVY